MNEYLCVCVRACVRARATEYYFLVNSYEHGDDAQLRSYYV